MTASPTLASTTLARMCEYRSDTRTFTESVVEVLLKLERGEFVIEEIQTLRNRCTDQLRKLEMNGETTLFAADRSALKATEIILLEVQTTLGHDVATGLGAALRNRFRKDSAAAVAAHAQGRRDEAAAWRTRVTHVLDVYLIQKGVVATAGIDDGHQLQLALRRRVTATNPKTAAQTRDEEMFEGVKRLLGIVELSSEQTAAILASRELVLDAAKVSEREREHMQRMEAQVAALNARIEVQGAALNARQKRTDVMLGLSFFFPPPEHSPKGLAVRPGLSLPNRWHCRVRAL